MMAKRIHLGKFSAEVIKKDIKNIHLSVYPPSGTVRISAPLKMKMDDIRVYAISRLGWIKKQQDKLKKQERETQREYIDQESHYLWGKRYLLKVVVEDGIPTVELKHDKIILHIHPRTNNDKRRAVLEAWYRDKLKDAIPPLIAKWEKLVGVQIKKFYVRRMKTKWGSCNPTVKSIRINTELAKKPPECLEYIVVHELVHLIEPTHNSRFLALMDHLMPKWSFYRDSLNEAPLAYEEWDY